MEDKYVHEVYSSIYKQFDNTRFCIWDFVDKYISSLPKGDSLLDCGTGNGKNSIFAKKHGLVVKAFDYCKEFVELCNDKGIDTFVCDTCSIPLPDSSFDYAISIAVIHHLFLPERRIAAIEEIIRVCRKSCLISVLSLENQKDVVELGKVEKINDSDFLIKFGNSKRYYHYFTRQELEEILSQMNINYRISSSHGNWFIIINKS